MSRLTLRVFIAFWAVIVISLVAVVFTNTQVHEYRLGEERQRDRSDFIERRVVEPASRALARAGEPGLRRWLARARVDARPLKFWIVDADGRELLARRLPPGSGPVVADWREGRLARNGQEPDRPYRILRAPDGKAFLLLLLPPARPLLFRLFGPFGPFGLLLVAIVTSGLVSFVLARTLAQPLQQMRAAGSALGGGQLDTRLPEDLIRRRDEVGDLARDFNRMAEQLSSRITGQRQLLRDVSHELRSPLARIQVALSLAERDPDARHLDRIRTECEQLDALVGEILGYARMQHGDTLNVESFDLVDRVADIVADAALEGRTRGVEVTLQAPDVLEVQGDPQMLSRAIENVLRNAVRHSPERGAVRVEVDEGGQQVEIRVLDSGPGVPVEGLERMFEPFVRLSPERSETGSGGGIGLAIARAAVERHQGRIRAANLAGGGLAITISFPRHFVTLRAVP